MPLISFIIPAYNIPEELLLECMESVMKLNLQPHERQIVVVDDGSEKPVEPLIRKCFGDDVKVVRQQNQGLSAARNVGMELATAQYIQFLDADDALLTNQYNDCIRVLKEKKPDILRFDYNKTSKDCRPNMKVKEYASGALFMCKHNLRSGACSYIFRKSILGNLQFTQGIYHEDEEFTPLLFVKAKRLVNTDAKPYFYRQRDTSIVHSCDFDTVKKRLSDLYEIILRLKGEALKAANKDAVVSNALYRRTHQLAMDYLINVRRFRNSAKESMTLKEAKAKLKDARLYPLPNKGYTAKYVLFRLISPFLR